MSDDPINLIPGFNPAEAVEVSPDHGIFKLSGLLYNIIEDQADCEDGINFTHPRNKVTL